jgi:hypothetical protein
MSVINNPIVRPIQDFVANEYSLSPKPVLFWDTSSVLEILRFPYRKGDLNSYRALNRINGLIQADTIYSVASSLTITEWNDHQENIKLETQESLEKTQHYHNTCIQIINEIFGSAYIVETIHDKGLADNFEVLADSVIARTIFLTTDEIAQPALDRVRLKQPPSKKKPEFKDCAIWETALKLSRDIYAIDPAHHQVFYSVNTEDFIDKSKNPLMFHAILLTEASLSRLHCSYLVEDANANL